jgi:hypothetical protein
MKQLGAMVIKYTTYFYIQKLILLTKFSHMDPVFSKITTPQRYRPVALCNVSRIVGSGFVILCVNFMLQSAEVAVPCQYDNHAALWRAILSRGDIYGPSTNRLAKLIPSLFQSHY